MARKQTSFKWLKIGLLGLLAVVGIWQFWPTPPAYHNEILFTGGDIVTVTQGTKEAMLVRDGRIVAIGTKAEVTALASGDAQQYDLEGKALLPGLIEPHTHPIATAQFGAAVDISGFTHSNRAEVMQTLKEAAEQWSPNGWTIAFGWDPVMVDDLEPPTLAELDALSAEKPLVILTQMMHDAYANSAALKAAAIGPNTPNPVGGEFVRDADGKLTGTVREVNAIGQLFSHVPPPPAGSIELITNMQFGAYARAGFTTIAAAGLVSTAHDQVTMYKRLAAHPDAPVQAIMYGLPNQLPAQGGPQAATEPGAIIGVKFWMDGSPYAGGAATDEPYTVSDLTVQRLHLPPGHIAPLNYDAMSFQQAFETYHRRGYQVAVHVQGERAVEQTLDVVSTVQAAYPNPGLHHRMEHNALITSGQLARAKTLGMTTSFFVDHVTFYGHRLPEIFGPERTARYMPVKAAIDAGLRVSLHADNPATPIGPMRTFAAAVTRQPHRGGPKVAPDQAITRLEALRAMTIDAAWQLGLAEERGSLEVGKAADLVILSANPLTAPEESLATITAEATWISGRRIDSRKTTAANAALLWEVTKGLF